MFKTLTVDNIQTCQVFRHLEEHVAVGIQILEALGVVRELVTRVGRGGVAQEYALYLARVLRRHRRIIWTLLAN